MLLGHLLAQGELVLGSPGGLGRAPLELRQHGLDFLVVLGQDGEHVYH